MFQLHAVVFSEYNLTVLMKKIICGQNIRNWWFIKQIWFGSEQTSYNHEQQPIEINASRGVQINCKLALQLVRGIEQDNNVAHKSICAKVMQAYLESRVLLRLIVLEDAKLGATLYY